MTSRQTHQTRQTFQTIPFQRTPFQRTLKTAISQAQKRVDPTTTICGAIPEENAHDRARRCLGVLASFGLVSHTELARITYRMDYQWPVRITKERNKAKHTVVSSVTELTEEEKFLFLSYIVPSTDPRFPDCLTWTGSYYNHCPTFIVRRNKRQRSISALRVAHYLAHGSFPTDRSRLARRCLNQDCVNLEHLSPAPPAERIKLGQKMAAIRLEADRQDALQLTQTQLYLHAQEREQERQQEST